jgi:hypothetical protein
VMGRPLSAYALAIFSRNSQKTFWLIYTPRVQVFGFLK